jgi:acyl carrier protein|tara:strand:- start:955 stop:1185 length:231 start_codon:yes stop_codon:yes gene_type:complete
MSNKGRVEKCVREALSLPEETALDPDATFEEFGADSLDILAVVEEVETEFDITLDDEEANLLNTINKVTEYVEKKL